MIGRLSRVAAARWIGADAMDLAMLRERIGWRMYKYRDCGWTSAVPLSVCLCLVSFWVHISVGWRVSMPYIFKYESENSLSELKWY